MLRVSGDQLASPLLRTVVLLIVGAGIIVAATHGADLTPLAIRDAIANRWFSPIVFVLLQVVCSLLFVPRTLLGVAAGLIFGMLWGSVWALAGATVGAAVGFALVRWIGASGMLDRSAILGNIVQRAEGGGWRSVAIVRLLPVPHSVANTALAMTNVQWHEYLLGSFLGMLPMTLVQVEVGSSGGAMITGQTSWIVGCFLLAMGLAATFLLRHAAASK